ncbi:hypothetical protein K438DRAFT_1815008 [Mycena galopus ATCC 62051]|nr:hypothetical protein K438DRAFT_1815008 [Mycena galopus ATCC 62051]
MARMSVPSKSYGIGFLVGAFAAVFFILLPALIERYYPAAAPVATVITWVGDKGALGFTAIMFTTALFLLSSLVCDTQASISRVFNRRTTGPIALEEGVAMSVPAAAPAPAANIAAEDTAAASANSRIPKNSQPSVISKLFSLLCATYFISSQFLTRDIVSLQRPSLDNVGAALLHLLRGFEVLFAIFLVLVLVAGVKKQWRSASPAAVAAPAPAPPVQGLIPVDVAVAYDEKEELVEEAVAVPPLGAVQRPRIIPARWLR